MRTELIYIADDNKKFANYRDCLQYEKKLEMRKKREYALQVKEASDRFLMSVGFNPNIYKSSREMNRALDYTWLIFDKYGRMEGLKTCYSHNYPMNGCDFSYASGNRKDKTILDNWLREHRLYAHLLRSFVERSYLDFYEWNMLRKLENLGWKVEHGMIA